MPTGKKIEKLRKQHNWDCPYQSVVIRGENAVLNHFDGHSWVQFTVDLEVLNEK